MIELALTYQFDAVELDISEFAGRVKIHGMAYARRLLDSAKLPVGTSALPFRLDADEASFHAGLAKLAEEAPLAVEVGCTRFLTSIVPTHETRPYHDNFEWHRQRLSEVCKALEPAGVRLGVGFRGATSARKGALAFIQDLDALVTLVKMVGAANLGVVFDAWEVFVAGGSVENLGGLSPAEIVAVYLSDLPAETELAAATDRDRLLPGAGGRIPVAAVAAALTAGRYDGPVIPRCHPSRVKGKRRDQVAAQATSALDAAWREAALIGQPEQHTEAPNQEEVASRAS